MYKLNILLACIVISSCSSENNSNSLPKVNLLGVWHYTFTTENTSCDGLEAIGIYDFQSLNGDVTRLGDTIIQGENFGFDYPGSATWNCIYVTIDFPAPYFIGKPSSQTIEQYKAIRVDNLKNNKDYRNIIISKFTDTEITETIELAPGYKETTTLRR